MREHPGEETAQERYDRIRAEHEASGAPGYAMTGWAGYCTAPNFCTRPCVECRETGKLADAQCAGVAANLPPDRVPPAVPSTP